MDMVNTPNAKQIAIYIRSDLAVCRFLLTFATAFEQFKDLKR
jgi:hypothetical protein